MSAIERLRKFARDYAAKRLSGGILLGSGSKSSKRMKQPGRRKMSAYNLFVKQHRKHGLSMVEIGKMWRSAKKGRGIGVGGIGVGGEMENVLGGARRRRVRRIHI